MKNRTRAFLPLLCSIILFSLAACQPANQSMNPAALKDEVRKTFEKRGIAVIDSMTAICDQRVADATK